MPGTERFGAVHMRQKDLKVLLRRKKNRGRRTAESLRPAGLHSRFPSSKNCIETLFLKTKRKQTKHDGVHTHNPRTQEVEAEGPKAELSYMVNLKPSWAI